MAQLTFNSLNEVLQFADSVRGQGNVTLKPVDRSRESEKERWARREYEDALYYSNTKDEVLSMCNMELHHLMNAFCKAVSEHRKDAEDYNYINALAWHINQRLVDNVYDSL